MGSNYTDDFFREVYNAELDRHHKLHSADSLLIAVLVAFSGVGVYYLKVLPSCVWGIAEGAFIAFFGLFLVAFLFATGFVIAACWPRNSEYIAAPKEWGAFVEGLREYYAHYHDQQEAEKRVADDLARALRQKYMEAGECNRNLNIKIAAYQTRAKYSITALVVLMLVNAIPTYSVQSTRSETQKTEVIAFPDVQKIEIVK